MRSQTTIQTTKLTEPEQKMVKKIITTFRQLIDVLESKDKNPFIKHTFMSAVERLEYSFAGDYALELHCHWQNTELALATKVEDQYKTIACQYYNYVMHVLGSSDLLPTPLTNSARHNPPTQQYHGAISTQIKENLTPLEKKLFKVCDDYIQQTPMAMPVARSTHHAHPSNGTSQIDSTAEMSHFITDEESKRPSTDDHVEQAQKALYATSITSKRAARSNQMRGVATNPPSSSNTLSNRNA